MPFDGQTYTGDPILAVIDRVDELICDEEHWGQGGGRTTRPLRIGGERTGRHCPRTALTELRVPWQAGFCQVDDYFRHALIAIDQRFAYWGKAAVPDYNNAPERTFPEIKALIRKARELRLADIMETVDA